MQSSGRRIDIVIGRESFAGRPSKAFLNFLKYSFEQHLWTSEEKIRVEVFSKENSILSKEGPSNLVMETMMRFALINWWVSVLQLLGFLVVGDFDKGSGPQIGRKSTRGNLLKALNFLVVIDLSDIPKTNHDKEQLATSFYRKPEV